MITTKKQVKKEFIERTDKIHNGAERLLEVDANKFAYDLLMPEKIFIEMYKKHNGNLLELASAFLVCRRDIELRAINLGLRTTGMDLLN